MSSDVSCNRPSVRYRDAVFVKLPTGQWTLGEVVNVALDKSSVRIKFCLELSAADIATSDTTIHRTHKETYSIDSPLWRRDYKLLQQIQLRRKRYHEEKAIQARYNRLKKDWETDDRNRDWSRTWSCKSRKEQLKSIRRKKIEGLARAALLSASEDSKTRSNGSPTSVDTTSQSSKLQLQIEPQQSIQSRQNRHRFDPAQWADYASQQHELKLAKQFQGHEATTCDEIEKQILESPDFDPYSSLCSTYSSDDDEFENDSSSSSSFDDGFYLSDEDLPSLYGPSALSYFDTLEATSPTDTISVGDDSSESIHLNAGDSVDIEDQKTGFLRVEYGPKTIQLLPSERILSNLTN